MSSGGSSTSVASCFLADTIAARNASHATPAHAAPDRAHAAMGLLVDDVVLPLGAQSVLVQALELFREAKAAAVVSHHSEDRDSRLAELAKRDATGQRSHGLAAVHAALDKLEALHAQHVAMLQRAASISSEERRE
jgi:hypothetical protein